MKQITTLVLSICLIFASCQVEKLDTEVSQEDNSFIAPPSHKKKKNTKESNSDCISDITGLEASLPDVVSAQTTAKPGDESYFTLDILDTNLAGTDISAWCVDVDLSLGIEGPLDFAVYSSYEELPAGSFENPDNFDLVNWILNQSFAGSASPNGGNYTFGHVQWAIWELIDNENCVSCTYLTNPTGEWKDDDDNVTKGLEIVQVALDNGEGFVPQCGQQIAIVLIPEGKQPIVIMKEIPSLDCGECEGKITDLELEYNGPNTANIVVTGKAKKGKNGHDAPIIFEGIVNPGESFTIYGHDDKGTLGTEIKIYVDGNEHTKIHTSCSDPDVGPGYISGDFTVIRGASREGGELCPSDNPGGGDDDNEDCDCDGKLTELDLSYIGESALITVKTKGKGKKSSGAIIFEANIDNGGIINLVGNDDKGTLGTEITIYINDEEAVKIHTSCSDPNVLPGYVVENFTVIRGASRNNGELCSNDDSNSGY